MCFCRKCVKRSKQFEYILENKDNTIVFDKFNIKKRTKKINVRQSRRKKIIISFKLNMLTVGLSEFSSVSLVLEMNLKFYGKIRTTKQPKRNSILIFSAVAAPELRIKFFWHLLLFFVLL